MRALLVEDDVVTRHLVQRILRDRGHEVAAFSDAETAWSSCRDTVYPLIVLDWLLPGMDGLQLCRQIRALPSGDRSVVVVLTGRDQHEDLQHVLDAGADDYLTKPIDASRLNVRLAIAERQVGLLQARKDAEAKVAAVMTELQHSRDDLLSILNELRIGTAITDAEGHITFLSRTGHMLLGKDPVAFTNLPWDEVLPFDAQTKMELNTLFETSPAARFKVNTQVETSGGQRYWMDVEVKDDPRDPVRKIFLLYDMTEVHDLRRLLGDRAHFEDLIGKSEVMLRVYQQIRDVSAFDSTVLIEGDTGTGKELVARAIHTTSHRSSKPFIAMNCAGLTDSLLGSQLFGHKRGAFTGAIEDHKGVFEAADGGTLFLDEIGDIPMNVQTSLLRVLQEREIVRLGESTPRRIDVRVVAATHHDLADDVAKGTFRADLLYRIRIARIQLPPLAERREDIPYLVSSFLAQFRTASRKMVDSVSNDAMRRLMEYGWPGNVRELRAAIEFAIIHCRGALIEVGDLPPEVLEKAATQSLPTLHAVEDERERLLSALDRSRGSRVEAARLLGISRATLYRRLTEHGIPTKIAEGADQ